MNAFADPQVAEAWEQFVTGEDPPPVVRSDVLASWSRCRDEHQLDWDRRRAPHAPDPEPPSSSEAEVVLAELAGIARSAEAQVASTGGLAVVADGTARVLAGWGARQAFRRAEDQNFLPWSVWTEGSAGTNGLALSLLGPGVATISGFEHWCTGFRPWSCAGVAVRDPVTGEPLGILDLSAHGQEVPSPLRAWMSTQVETVRAGLRERAAVAGAELLDAFDDATRHDPSCVGASDAGGRLVALTPAGRSLLDGLTGDRPLRAAVGEAIRRAGHDPDWAGTATVVPAGAEPVVLTLTPVRRRARLVGMLLRPGQADGPADAAPAPAPPTSTRVVGVAGDRLAVLRPGEIRFAEADGHDVWLDTDRGRLRARDRGIGQLEKRLRPEGFLRAHRRYLVNTSRVVEVVPGFKGGVWVVLDGPAHPLVPVSERQVPELWRCLGGHGA